MISIGMIEDSLMLRKNLEKMFDYDPDMDLYFSLPSVEQLISNTELHKNSPAVILLDIELPGISGLDGIPILRKIYPSADIVIITGNMDEDVIWSATVRGAKGYLLKPVAFAQLKEQLYQIREGSTLISPVAANILVRKLNGITEERRTDYEDILTKKEAEVVSYFLKGFTYKQIAMVMQISVSTVNDHQKKIYKKLNVNSKYELLARFLPN
ncbi:response regulator [Dinghuibacter silviterrae]|uniref:LuxR family two component transcriptional regulator n=1 Tax=Dinghuibacter silviterrae TaxID=1539049 RepID=A0A4R8DTV0_9BACT|nr:response regulator transcription factor [Dinghuibacter silviterrae]TDX01762.1 LuxR family two component transcriptional regulator [Dinghuibacter silviterrae]